MCMELEGLPTFTARGAVPTAYKFELAFTLSRTLEIRTKHTERNVTYVIQNVIDNY